MIRIDLNGELMHGHEATFQAPCDCSEITKLIAYYPSGDELKSQTFTFRDAHGNNLGDLGDLFVKDAFIKVILDKVNSYAYIQNADTNGYLEDQIAGLKSDLTKYLPLEGGTLSGNLKVANGGGHLYSDGNAVYLSHLDATSTSNNHILLSRYVELKNAFQMRRLDNGVQSSYAIFGEHNKPSGSYVGNGSATQRKITIGAITQIVAIRSGNGLVILSPTNGVCISNDGTVTGIKTSEAYTHYLYADIYLTTVNTLLNENGTTYWWTVL